MVVKLMLRRIAQLAPDGLEHYEDSRAPTSMYDRIDGSPGWYYDMNNRHNMYYHDATQQYQLADGNWWDPVNQRSYKYNGTWYVNVANASDLCFYDTDFRYKNVSQSPAGKWLTENYARSRGQAKSLIQGYVYSDKPLAWTMFENWNLVYPSAAITHEEVGLKSGQRDVDIARATTQDVSVPITTAQFTSISYRLSNRPTPGTSIALPNNQEVSSNVDYYWQGKADEMGGDASDRKFEKHGYDASEGYAFARKNNSSWFVQVGMSNHIIFHDFPGTGGIVRMAVWNWTNGQMVTYYDIDQTVTGGVEQYLRNKGM
jgi:hypothetical protein